MSEINNTPVIVTGEERRHPAIRKLARACIALARLQVERPTAAAEKSNDGNSPKLDAAEEVGNA